MLLNIVLGLLVIVLGYSWFRLHRRLQNNVRCTMTILHRIKASGTSYDRELSYMCGLNRRSMSALLASIEAKGLIKVEAIEKDYPTQGCKRTSYSITREGEKLVDAMALAFANGIIPIGFFE